jgi:hypothetical protein
MIVRQPAFFVHVINCSLFRPPMCKAKPDLRIFALNLGKSLFPVVLKIFNPPTILQLRVHMLSLVFDLSILRSSYNVPESSKKNIKGIDRPFRGWVKSSLIRSLFINWRLGNFFLLILKGFHHKISKKPIDAA